MNVSFSRTGASGSSTLPSCIAEPVPFAHHSFEWKPLPEKRQANRTGGGEPSRVSSPQTGTDSSHGRATDTPTPRRNVRRDKGCFIGRSGLVSLILPKPPPPHHPELRAPHDRL